MKLEEACGLAIQKAGGSTQAAIDLLRQYAIRDAALRAELRELAIDQLLNETKDQAINDGFSLTAARLASEVGPRIRRRHLRVVRGGLRSK
jgi:hypothetical protein